MYPPTTIQGNIVGDGYSGPHYNNPSSSAWKEIKVELEANKQYRFILDWSGDSDLDLYLYSPGKAPSIDGTGNDYVAYSAGTDKPEVIVYTPSQNGVWVLGIDMYSSEGVENFVLNIEVLSGGGSSSGGSSVYTPPVVINGSVSGSTSGVHYNDPNSPSWVEFEVSLTAGTTYIITLDWEGTSDLDLYVYAPGTAPSEDGNGDDYVVASNTISKPESIVFTPNVSGDWVIGVDHYSLDGETNFVLKIDVQGSSASENTITGSVSSDGVGSHYNSPASPAWTEHKVYLEVGKKYRVALEWDSHADLDLYVYAPGTAPSEDGNRDDYYARAFTSSNPKVIEFTPTTGGEWILGVDMYSGSGSVDSNFAFV